MFARISAALRSSPTERPQPTVPHAQAGEQADGQQGLPPGAVAEAEGEVGSIPLIGVADTPQVAQIRADIEASKRLPSGEALQLLDMTRQFACELPIWRRVAPDNITSVSPEDE